MVSVVVVNLEGLDLIMGFICEVVSMYGCGCFLAAELKRSRYKFYLFFLNDPATTEISPFPLPDALPICQAATAALINVPPAIKTHFLDSLLFCAVRNQLADLFGGGDVPAGSSAPRCLGRRSRNQ